MADADLDVVIRQLAEAAEQGHPGRGKTPARSICQSAAKAKDSETKERYKQIARNTMMQGTAAAKRLQLAADKRGGSYARSIRNAAQAGPVKKAAKKSKPDSTVPIGKEARRRLKARREA